MRGWDIGLVYKGWKEGRGRGWTIAPVSHGTGTGRVGGWGHRRTGARTHSHNMHVPGGCSFPLVLLGKQEQSNSAVKGKGKGGAGPDSRQAMMRRVLCLVDVMGAPCCLRVPATPRLV